MAAKTGKKTDRKGPVPYRAAAGEIGAGDIKAVYLLYGDEGYLQDRFIAKLRDAWLGGDTGGGDWSREDGRGMTQAQAVDLAGQMTLFSDRKLLVIDEPAFIPAGKEQGKGSGEAPGVDGPPMEEAGGETGAEGAPRQRHKSVPQPELPLVAYLEQPAAGACLVLRCPKGKPDRRHKLVAAIAGAGGLVEAAALDPGDRLPYLKEALQQTGKQCARGVLEKISRQPGSLAFCVRELEKAAAYAGEESEITEEMADAVLTPSLESNIFRLVDALGQRREARALQELRALLDNGEPPFSIFAMMLRQYRLIFRAKACLQAGMGRTQIAQTLKVLPFAADNAAAQSKYYSFPELENAMELFCDKDLAMKSGIPYRQALEDLIIALRH
ncbi:MAG: DNA polymerase III subunit delta [Clostridiales bacterium]|nr:DNA polymerase III subunit delta [Clostridiales bacterium]